MILALPNSFCDQASHFPDLSASVSLLCKIPLNVQCVQDKAEEAAIPDLTLEKLQNLM